MTSTQSLKKPSKIEDEPALTLSSKKTSKAEADSTLTPASKKPSKPEADLTLVRSSKKPPKTEDELVERRLRKVRSKRSRKALVIRLVITAAVVYLAFGIFFGIAVVQGDSMSPALQEGDLALFQRVGASYRTGDIVLVETDDGTEYVKRVVGLPGQTVDIDDDTGELLIDGEVLTEPYVYDGGTYAKAGVEYPLTLGEDEYFVLGDNRDNSWDSRNYGAISANQLDGRMLFIFFRWQG